MYQRAREDKVPVMSMKYSPHEMSERTLILCSTFNNLDDVVEALQTLRTSALGGGIGVDFPPVVEVSSRVRPGTIEWTEREAAYASGRYIAVGTKMAATGMDIKPHPPWLLIDGGTDVEEHRGSIIGNVPTDDSRKRQAWGRVMRNSSDRDGLIYHRQIAGTREWEVINYPETSRCSNPIIAEDYALPLLSPVEDPVTPRWPTWRFARQFPKNISQALMFVNLSYAQGVKERDMERFYNRHWVDGWKLSDDYEWVQSCMAHTTGKSGAPAWTTLYNYLIANPFLWNVPPESIPDGRSSEHGLTAAGPLRPVNGKMHQLHNLMVNQPKYSIPLRGDEENTEALSHSSMMELAEKQTLNAVKSLKKAATMIYPIMRNQGLDHVTKRTLGDVVRFLREAQQSQTHPSVGDPEVPKARELVNRLASLEFKPDGRSTMQKVLLQSCQDNEGVGYCVLHNEGAIYDGSGPHTHDSVTGVEQQSLPCGCFAHLPGRDHILNPQFRVLRRGSAWTSKYDVTEQFYRNFAHLLEIGSVPPPFPR
jgi:hypothetical protein